MIHFIDDNSRLIVGYGYYFNDSARNVQEVLKKAIKKYGIPKQIYLDNGKSYKNIQLDIICARLGIKLTHTHAYDPSAKGKVERSFKTIKEGWMYARDWNKYESLESLEKDYGEYLYEEYINKEHRELKDTPNNVWHKGIEKTKHRRIEEERLEEMFMHKETRRVSNDRVISFNNILYEVPYKYVGEEIEIFNENALNALYNASGGNIRKLNNLIITSMMIGYQKEAREIDEEIVRLAKEEKDG